MASVFKVPIMVEIFRQIGTGKLKLTQRIALEDKHRTIGSGVILNLQNGLKPTIRDLLMLMIIISDNTATNMLLDLVGPKTVTKTMASLGLSDINIVFDIHKLFRIGVGLPLSKPSTPAQLHAANGKNGFDRNSVAYARDKRNNVSSARAMAKLLAMSARKEILDEESCRRMTTILRSQQLTQRVPRYLPWGTTANKTGSLSGQRNDAGFFWRGEGDGIAFALFTYDPTPFPLGNSRVLLDRTAAVEQVMADVGWALWEHFARPSAAKDERAPRRKS
jgi:beta-lactamase class A